LHRKVSATWITTPEGLGVALTVLG
jgi:hypothetical protein